MNNRLIYRFFLDDDFLRISRKIKEMEKITSGEIKVSIKDKNNFRDRKKGIHKRAEDEFYKLGMNITRDRSGILLFLQLNERQFYILADEGINSKVQHDTWEKVKDEIQDEFRHGHFSEGIIRGIEMVGKILSEHFPIKIDDTNELSNKVIIK